MKIPKLPEGGLKTILTRAGGRTKLFLGKHSPEILVGGGVILMGVSIYFFCKATLKAQPEKELHRKEMDAIRSTAQSDREEGMLSLDEIDRREAHELFDERRHYAWEMIKIYSRPFSIATCGALMIFSGFKIINGRYIKVSGAYNLLQESYNNYRERVRNEYGEEKDREFFYGMKRTEEEAIIEDENGNKKKITQTVLEPDKSIPQCSPYARFFDEYSTQWTNNPEYNLLFLRGRQNYANDKLRTQGHLFLNEVYEMLGLPHTQAGSVVGWVYDKDHGDNFVDFGIYDLKDEIKRCFVNGYEPSILLDFNVCGVIHDLI